MDWVVFVKEIFSHKWWWWYGTCGGFSRCSDVLTVSRSCVCGEINHEEYTFGGGLYVLLVFFVLRSESR